LKKRFLETAEWFGHMFFYCTLLTGGQRTAYLFLYPVIFVYVLCSRKIHKNLQPYLVKRFPDHSSFQYWLDAYKCVLEFGRILIDRAWIGLKKNSSMQGFFENSEQLKTILKTDRGLVVLLAHVGNWQTSFADLGELDTDVYSLMEYNQQQVAKHFFDLNKQKSFSIIDTHGFMGGMVEAAAVLQRGAMVLTMADRYVAGPETTVQFLGSPLRLPLAPYSLAASTNSLLLILFSAKTGRNSYQLRIWDIIEPENQGKPERKILENYAKRFSLALEKYVKLYPYQWFNFFDIWKQ
jgi:predicted LPLAT superfamily acyltransferase